MSGLKNKLPDRYTSIVIASYISNELRAKMFLTSLTSLLETTKDLPVEIIIVDNGGNEGISKMLLEWTRQNIIHCYIRNATNMHFGEARNQGMAMAKGNYICIADNDIFYEAGWLEACLDALERYQNKKIYATPIQYPTPGLIERYSGGELKVHGKRYKLNMRAGSNCFVVRRKDMEIIGNFQAHRIAGSRWTDRASKLGYLAAVTPVDMIKDLGLRNGYMHNRAIPIKRVLTNGQEVIFNTDELQ